MACGTYSPKRGKKTGGGKTRAKTIGTRSGLKGNVGTSRGGTSRGGKGKAKGRTS